MPMYDEIRDYWPYTSTAIEATEPKPLDLDDDEPERGNRLLRALAEQGQVQRIADGVWIDSGSGPGWAR